MGTHHRWVALASALMSTVDINRLMWHHTPHIVRLRKRTSRSNQDLKV